MKPWVKWAGGKTRFVDQILATFPEQFNTYREPFLGSGAVWLALQPRKAVLGDLCSPLINMYKQARDEPDRLIKLAEWLLRDHTPEQYKLAREQFNTYDMADTDRAALFLYLNRSCFNGLWRVNKRDHFNVPAGNHRCFLPSDLIRAAQLPLQRASFANANYMTQLQLARPGDLVYLDPPYEGTFQGYTRESFNTAELLCVATALQHMGCHVVISNSDTPLVRKLFSQWTIQELQRPNTVGAKTSGHTTELLISGGPF